MCFRPSDTSVVELPLICPECGQENAPGEKKCMFCGAELRLGGSVIDELRSGEVFAHGSAKTPKPFGGVSRNLSAERFLGLFLCNFLVRGVLSYQVQQ